MRALYLYALTCVFSAQSSLAFEDIYEPDDSLAESGGVFVGDIRPRRHTLHDPGDEDWFRFEARAGVIYELKASSVGADIDVEVSVYDAFGSLKAAPKNKNFEGEPETLPFKPKETDTYHVRIKDTSVKYTSPVAATACRAEIQYDFSISEPKAEEKGFITGKVFDLIYPDAPVPNVKVCEDNNCDITKDKDEDRGEYYLEFVIPEDQDVRIVTLSAGWPKTGAEKIYNIALCTGLVVHPQKQTIQNFYLLRQDMSLPALQVSRGFYRSGDSVRVSVPPLPTECANYYAGIYYPDGRFMVFDGPNRRLPITQSLPVWPMRDDTVMFEQNVDGTLPTGQYFLYLLRMPAAIEDAMNNVHLGELGVSAFRIE